MSSNLYEENLSMQLCWQPPKFWSPRRRQRLPLFSSTAWRQARVQQMSVTVRNPAQWCSMNELWCCVCLVESTLLHTGHIINLLHVVRTLVVRFVEGLASCFFLQCYYAIWYYLIYLNICDIQIYTVSWCIMNIIHIGIQEVQPPAQLPFTLWMVEWVNQTLEYGCWWCLSKTE